MSETDSRSQGLDLIKWGMVTLAIPASTAIYGHFHGEALRESEIVRRDADLLLKLLPGLSSVNPAEVQLTQRIVFSLDASDTASTTLREMASHLREVSAQQTQSTEPAVATTGARTQEAADLADPKVAPTAPVAQSVPTERVASPPAPSALTAETRPTRVFIQIYDARQRPVAETLRAILRAQGVPVPGIENVRATYPNDPAIERFAQRGSVAVRYFRSGDRASAEAVAGLIAGDAGEPVVVQDATRVGSGVRERQIEIWFPLAR